MNKKILLFFLLQLIWLNALPLSGRLITPYFKAIGYYDYVVKGKVINHKVTIQYGHKVAALQVVVLDKLGQDLEDTIWIEPISLGDDFPVFEYEHLPYSYYFAIKITDKQLIYNPLDHYFLLRIRDGGVSTMFTSFDRFLLKMPFINSYRTMKIEKFERKLGRRLN